GYAIGDAASRPDAGVLAENAILAQHHVGPNGDMLPDLGRTMHYRGGVDAGRLTARFMQQPGYSGKSQPRLTGNDQGFVGVPWRSRLSSDHCPSQGAQR